MFSRPLKLLILCVLFPSSTSQTTLGPPTAVLSGNVTVQGLFSSGLERFLGIPFAQPPIGRLRYALPQDLILEASTTINASAFGPACMQEPSESFPLSAMSEDCLSINVFRPSGTVVTTGLPVMVWIFGGSYTSGGSSAFDPTVFIQRSVANRDPVIYVSFNYRVNSFGFLASTELASAAQDGTAGLNLGLYDMQAALIWVQNNIHAFGGDPNKVTAFGESVGALSIGSLLVADGGQAVHQLGLFRAAIMESGAPSGDGVPPPAQLDGGYQTFAELSGCGSDVTNGAILSCLRNQSAAALLNGTIASLANATLAQPFQRVIDGYFHDSAPSVQVRSGRFADVPLLMGNVLDEGTIFASTNTSNSTEVVPALFAGLYTEGASSSFRTEILPQVLELYPDDPMLGSPFDPFNASKSDRFYPPASTNQYKRMASILGDMIFHSGRRLLNNATIARDPSGNASVYNYVLIENTSGAAPALGVYHSSDLPFVYGQYAAQTPNTTAVQTSLLMMDYWIAFANSFDPNRPNLPTWPKYGTAIQRYSMQLGSSGDPETPSRAAGGITRVIPDTFREEGIAFFASEAWSSQINI